MENYLQQIQLAASTYLVNTRDHIGLELACAERFEADRQKRQSDRLRELAAAVGEGFGGKFCAPVCRTCDTSTGPFETDDGNQESDAKGRKR